MDEIKRVADEILKTQLEEGETIFIKEIEKGIYHAYINTTRRGPGHAIIGEDLSFLWGTSAIGYPGRNEKLRGATRLE